MSLIIFYIASALNLKHNDLKNTKFCFGELFNILAYVNGLFCKPLLKSLR